MELLCQICKTVKISLFTNNKQGFLTAVIFYFPILIEVSGSPRLCRLLLSGNGSKISHEK